MTGLPTCTLPMSERVRYELDMRPDEVLARLRANTVDAADKRAMFRAMLSSGPWMSAKIDGHSFRLYQHSAFLRRDPEFGHLEERKGDAALCWGFRQDACGVVELDQGREHPIEDVIDEPGRVPREGR